MAARRRLPLSVWRPPTYTKAEVRAVQAVFNATSENMPSAQECRVATEWIFFKAAGIRDDQFVPGDPSIVAYLLGRRSVGLAIADVLKLKPETIPDE